jgi:two-component system response regulator DegU
MINKIKVLIADDHPIVRQGLGQTIESDADLEVIAEAGDGLEALAKIRQYQPQVIILDIDIPKMDGFEVALAVQEEKIKTEIVFLTVHREESFMKKALSVGAKGFVLKDSAISDIVTAIKAAFQGQSFISPAMMSYLIKPRTSNGKEGL